MTLRLDAETRARAAALKAELRDLERPAREARRAQLKAAKEARTHREPRISHDTGKQTRGRVLDKGYLAWLRRLPCAAGAVAGGCAGRIEAAHLRYSDAARGRINPGLSTKPSDRYATPLCAGHHRGDQHMRRERDFWADLGIEPGDLTDALYAAYQAGADGAPIIQQFAERARAGRRAA